LAGGHVALHIVLGGRRSETTSRCGSAKYLYPGGDFDDTSIADLRAASPGMRLATALLPRTTGK